jgi:hypothetical protein
LLISFDLQTNTPTIHTVHRAMHASPRENDNNTARHRANHTQGRTPTRTKDSEKKRKKKVDHLQFLVIDHGGSDT